MLIEGMVELYKATPNVLSRLLNIAQELKALTVLLETTYFPFAIDLAALAGIFLSSLLDAQNTWRAGNSL